jgi:hypothetical protein
VLSTNGFTVAATRDDLDAWIETFGVVVTSMIDAPGHEMQSLDTLGIREATVVVELPTMKVAFYDDGDQSGTQTTAATMALDEVLQLLGGT